MVGITISSNIQNLLRTGLAGVVETARQEVPIALQIFKKKKSEKNYEQLVEVALTGLGRAKAEGTEFATDSIRQTYLTTAVNRAYGIRAIITREAMDDNLYKDQFSSTTDALKNAI